MSVVSVKLTPIGNTVNDLDTIPNLCSPLGKIEQRLPIHKTKHPLGTERVTLNYITHVQSRAEENHEVTLHFACGLIVWNKSLFGQVLKIEKAT